MKKITVFLLTFIVCLAQFNTLKVNAMNDIEFFCEDSSMTYSVDEIITNNNLKNMKCFNNYQEAMNYFKSVSAPEKNIVLRFKNHQAPNKVIAMSSGYAIATSVSTSTIYKNADLKINQFDGNYEVIIQQGSKMQYLDTVTNSNNQLMYKVAISGYEGFVRASEVDLLPSIYIEEDLPFTLRRSGTTQYYTKTDANYYRVINGELYFYMGLIGGGTSVLGPYAKAPSWMGNGYYYSTNGVNFYHDFRLTQPVNNGASFYNYFQYLPLRSRSNLSGAQLDQYLKSVGRTDSVYYGKSNDFITHQNKYGMNGLLVFSMANLESAYGTSYYAKDRNNLFGWNAIDSNPDNATYFHTVTQAIQEHMGINLFGYTNVNDWRFTSPALGNKVAGFNTKYASDPFWGLKIANIAYQVDKMFGFQDLNYYGIGLINNHTSANVRNQASPSATVLYHTNGNARKLINQTVAITRQVGNYVETPTWFPYINGTLLTEHNNGNYTNHTDKSLGYIDKSVVTVLSNGRWQYKDIGELPSPIVKPDPPAEPELGESGTFKVTATAGLILRSYPSTNSPSSAVVPYNTVLEGTYIVDKTWIKVTYNNTVGYISASYAELIDSDTGDEPVIEDPIIGEKLKFRVDAEPSLILRSKPGTDGQHLASIPFNTIIDGHYVENNTWVKTSYNNKEGYVSASYLVVIEPEKPVENPTKDYRITATARLNVRSQPNTSSSILGQLEPNSVVKGSLVENNKWLRITYQNKTGYISADYIEEVGTVKPKVDVARTLGYTLVSNTLTGMNLTTPVSTIVNKLKAVDSSINVTVTNSSGSTKASNANLTTGDRVTVTQSGQATQTFTIAVKGDINGDGRITSSDYVLVANHILNRNKLSNEKFIAGDINGDGRINSSDYVVIANHILGRKVLY